jgi:hypothetical protein
MLPSALDSWASAGPSAAWPEASSAHSFCGEEFAVGSPGRPLTGAVLWSFDRPEVAPVQLRDDGCGLLAGLGVYAAETLALWKPGFNSWSVTRVRGRALFAPSGTPAQLTVLAQSGWPMGVPAMMLNAVPSQSIVQLGGGGAVLDWQATFLPDGRLPGPIGTSQFLAFAAVHEPGWHRVSIEPPPGSICSQPGPVGHFESPTVQFARVEQGLMHNVHFSQCAPPKPE